MRNLTKNSDRLSHRLWQLIPFVCLVLLSVASFAQDRMVTGQVADTEDIPIVGAVVRVSGTNIGTTTGQNGYFSLKIPPAALLEVSLLGYQTKSIATGERMSFKVVLETEVTSIDKVVVVAYGAQKKASVVGAISTVSGTDVVKAPVGDIGNALTGRLPGLTTVQQTGQPGGSVPAMRIRGQGGVLVVVDGVELQTGSRITGSFGTSGNLSGWETINPQDVESVSILKDASATAVYGVRGANGVIIITTKKGLEERAQVSYSGSFSLSQPTNLSQPVNSADYVMYNREGNYNDGLPSTATYSYDRYNKFRYNYDPILYPSLDMNDYLLKKVAPKYDQNVSVRGGNKWVKYYTSAGFYNEDGIIKHLKGFPSDPNQHYDRLSLRSNLDFKLTKKLTVSLNMDVRFENRKGSAGTMYGDQSATDTRFFTVLHLAPPWITPGFDSQGRYIQSVVPTPSQTQILEAIIRGGIYLQRQVTTNSILAASYDLGSITEGLSVQGRYSFNSFAFNTGTRYPVNLLGQYLVPLEVDGQTVFRKMGDDPGTLTYNGGTGSGRFRKDYWEASLNYARTFGRHNVTGMLLFNAEKLYYHLPAPADVPRSYLGYVSRFTYNYDNRYLAEFNMGVNGSENFPKGKRFGIFPAVSAGWVLSEEPFMKNTKKVLDFFKIRGSYGSVGSDGGGGRFIYLDGPYTYYPDSYSLGYFSGFSTSFGDQVATRILPLREGLVGNPNISWSTAIKSNIGLETKLLGNKINLEFDYFYEKRKDIVSVMQNQPDYLYPQMHYFNDPFSVMANYARTSTRGFEISLGWNQSLKNFSYYLNASYSYATTTLDRISEPTYDYPWMYGQGDESGQVRGLVCEGYWDSYEQINDPSNPYNTFNSAPIPGDLKYKDINGDMKIDAFDYVNIGLGNASPPKYFALDLGCRWKNLSASALFQGSTGMYFIPIGSPAQVLMGSGNGIFDWISDRWTPSNRNGNYPVLHSAANNSVDASNFRSSSYWAYDATYVRLKNLAVSYTLPKKLFAGAGINDMTVSLTGQNLYTWLKDDRMSHFDPEMITQGALYPVMKIYSVALSITF